MATERSEAVAARWSLAELTTHEAHGDLLEIEPLELGPGTPASAALSAEREPTPLGDRDGQ